MQVYFDNSATTKPYPEVITAFTEVMETYYGNPSSLHALGLESEKLLSRSRQVIADVLAVHEDELIFTSGGTESINLAIQGVAFQYKQRGRHIITSAIEHAAVYNTCQRLATDFGFEVTYLPVDGDGLISLKDLQAALRDDTILVSLIHVNNEMGSIQPIEKIGRLLDNYPKVLFHVDDVQGFGKVPLEIKKCHIDLLSLSGHKFHAPKGTGLLYVRKGVELYPLLHGGGQQYGFRSGTENVPGYVALAKACRMVKEKEIDNINHLKKLNRLLREGLSQLEQIRFNTPVAEDKGAPHILSVSIKEVKPEVILHALEERGIYVSTKSACSSKNTKANRILTAIGLPAEYANSALRISLSAENTVEEVEYFLKVMNEIVPYYTKIMKV